jgi:nitroreductase
MLATLPGAIAMHRRADALADPDFHAFNHAPMLVVVYAKPVFYDPIGDCSMAVQNLLLAAHGLGLGACPIGSARIWFNLSDVKHGLGITNSYTAVMPIAVGWPKGRPAAPSRQEPEILTWDEDAAEPVGATAQSD